MKLVALTITLFTLIALKENYHGISDNVLPPVSGNVHRDYRLPVCPFQGEVRGHYVHNQTEHESGNGTLSTADDNGYDEFDEEGD